MPSLDLSETEQEQDIEALEAAYREWLRSLKPGDQVAVFVGRTARAVVEVLRVTPTQIVTEDDTLPRLEIRYNKPDPACDTHPHKDLRAGRERGGYTHLVRVTPEIVARVEEQKREAARINKQRENARLLDRVRWGEVPVEVQDQILALVRPVPVGNELTPGWGR